MVIRIMAATSLVTLLTFAIWAQRGQAPAGAPAAPAITGSEVAAMIAKSPSDKNALGQRMLQLGTYNVNMEHRVMGNESAKVTGSWCRKAFPIRFQRSKVLLR